MELERLAFPRAPPAYACELSERDDEIALDYEHFTLFPLEDTPFPFPYHTSVVREEIERIAGEADDRVAALLCVPVPLYTSLFTLLLNARRDDDTRTWKRVRSSHDVLTDLYKLLYVLELKMDVLQGDEKKNLMERYHALCKQRVSRMQERVERSLQAYVEALRARTPRPLTSLETLLAARALAHYTVDHVRMLEYTLMRMLGVHEHFEQLATPKLVAYTEDDEVLARLRARDVSATRKRVEMTAVVLGVECTPALISSQLGGAVRESERTLRVREHAVPLYVEALENMLSFMYYDNEKDCGV